MLLAACGSSGPSTSAFKSAFATQKATLHRLGQDIGAAVEGAPKHNDGELTQQFKGLAQRAAALAGALGQLDAPSQYRSELATLQSSVTQVAGTLHAIEAAAAANDETAAKAAGETIVTDAEQVKSVDQGLSKRLGLPGE